MTLRKGQHLFNEIAKLHILDDHKCTMNKDRMDLFPYANLHMILYYISDNQFDEIMNTLQPNLSNVRGKQ